tara:strand:- start:1315 stop:2352 length:1038 start_codon:yes stop_codon:yes gene_type:complete
MLNENELKILEFHSKYSNKIINVKIGSFNNEKLYESPNYSSGSMVFSNNAEKIPGISINSNWINIYNIFDLKAELFQGKFPKQPGYKGGPYLHYKSLLFKRSFNDLILGFSIQHAVQHGGYDQNNQKIPNTWENYVNVFFARSGDESQPGQDQAYRAGNGLGAFTLSLQTNNFKLYFEHYFDDKSGVKTLNFGDGLLGIEYLSKNINLNFELIDTTNQSGNKHPPGVDSYYYHDVYKFGWSNNGLTIGNSFINPYSNRKIIYNSNIKLSFEQTSFILQYANSKIFVPYLSKNNNLPYQNHNEILERNNYVMAGVEKKIGNDRMIMLSYAKEKSGSNIVLSYLFEL